ncbi:mitochondrial carrier domain-containing protein [Halteromyces radiatus]|uniref:mitochondrial carrier domain-containing protein n=1 Tax=Halteromyces radiatus TaxID=101107 RepID=UPI00221E4548|nr:mitochondrial carrier domain-containing protein [Halteromyces radiatus]KAI8096536.1 mitochondrial carrier domain-containing protein [Halteromyces radiatus]
MSVVANSRVSSVPTESQLFKDHFIAGGTALSLAYSCMHPLDTIKTRIQANLANNWRAIFSRETARSLGKGFFVSAMGAAGQGGARFSTYELCKNRMLPSVADKNKSWTIPVTALSAVLGDLASSVIKVPREVITAKLQTDHYGVGRATTAHVIRQTLIEEGPRGLFKGFWPIAGRDLPFMIILLVSYENFKAFHHRSVREDLLKKMKSSPRASYEQQVVAGAAFEELEADIPTLESIMYGGISGFLAGYFTTPMDVLRTRMITQKKALANTGGNTQQITVMQIAKSMVDRVKTNNSGKFNQSVGICRAFFSGAIPRSAWWFGICGIFFPTYETLKSIMANP